MLCFQSTHTFQCLVPASLQRASYQAVLWFHLLVLPGATIGLIADTFQCQRHMVAFLSPLRLEPFAGLLHRLQAQWCERLQSGFDHGLFDGYAAEDRTQLLANLLPLGSYTVVIHDRCASPTAVAHTHPPPTMAAAHQSRKQSLSFPGRARDDFTEHVAVLG